jgi:hypothetical protein
MPLSPTSESVAFIRQEARDLQDNVSTAPLFMMMGFGIKSFSLKSVFHELYSLTIDQNNAFSLLKAHVDLRRELLRNVLIVGGISRLPGFLARLKVCWPMAIRANSSFINISHI